MKISSLKRNFEIVELEEEKGLKLKKKNIVIYDKKIIQKIIEKDFKKRYFKIITLILAFNSSDESDDTIVRVQIEELRNFILNKYQKYLNKRLLNKYFNMLILLEQKIIIPENHRGR